MSEEKRPIIFAISDCDWIAAYDPESAKAFILQMVDADTLAEYERQGYPVELHDAELDELKFNLDSGRTPEGPLISFRERLAQLVASGEEFPQYFATSEF